MDTSQYLSMFLEESIENLQILNDSILELERNPEDIDRVNEIFRVAHTLKGMSATMGYVKIADLTHNMEDVLTKFRDGELKVTEKMVTVLFRCLDTLEGMVNNISEGVEDVTDIEELIQSLKDAAYSQNHEEAMEEVAAGKVEVTKDDFDMNEVDILAKLNLNEYDLSVMKQAQSRGYYSYNLKVTLDSNTLLKSARAFLLFKALEESGEIIKTNPNAEDIENENFEFEIEMIYLTKNDIDDIKSVVLSISEIENVEIIKINLDKDTSKHDIINKDIENYIEKKNPEIEKKDSKVVVKENKAKSVPKTDNKNEKVTNRKKVHQSVRVDLERLDNFLTMVSELVIHRTRLEQISSNHKLTDLNETLEQIARTTSDLQDLVMKIRMLPLEVVFNRFPRMIRDLSVELGKEIEFSIYGADTELDRTVIDEIGDPLLHLLRNAADHGIEGISDRIAKGKSQKGHIKLSAYPEGTKAVIKVEDDGAGLNVEKIKKKAEERGINTENMSDGDIKNLIFAQGFSTSEQVTDVSGRGVGMDVVKTKIASLGGTVDVFSEPEKGTTFIIRLPLTLQIIQALLVKIGDETMAISLGYIDRVLDYSEDMIKRTNNKEVMVFNDNVIPLIRVNEVLQVEKPENSKDYIVIVKVGEKSVGLLVNGLLGQQEIVIKPLGKTLRGLKEYIGATILGDGLVTLILDVAALI